MTTLTDDQIEFAKSMTIKQRGVLRALSMFDWFMSASERADAELYELIRHKLARCYGQFDAPTKLSGPFSWGATRAGRHVADCIEKGTL